MNSFNPESLKDLPIDMLEEKDIQMPSTKVHLRPQMHMADCAMSKAVPFKDTMVMTTLNLTPMLFVEPKYMDCFAYCMLILSPVDLTQEDASFIVSALQAEIHWEAVSTQDSLLHTTLEVLPLSDYADDDAISESEKATLARYPFQYRGYFFIKPPKDMFSMAVNIIKEQGEAISRVAALQDTIKSSGIVLQ